MKRIWACEVRAVRKTRKRWRKWDWRVNLKRWTGAGQNRLHRLRNKDTGLVYGTGERITVSSVVKHFERFLKITCALLLALDVRFPCALQTPFSTTSGSRRAWSTGSSISSIKGLTGEKQLPFHKQCGMTWIAAQLILPPSPWLSKISWSWSLCTVPPSAWTWATGRSSVACGWRAWEGADQLLEFGKLDYTGIIVVVVVESLCNCNGTEQEPWDPICCVVSSTHFRPLIPFLDDEQLFFCSFLVLAWALLLSIAEG